MKNLLAEDRRMMAHARKNFNFSKAKNRPANEAVAVEMNYDCMRKMITIKNGRHASFHLRKKFV